MTRTITKTIVCLGLITCLGCEATPEGPETVPAEGVVTLDGEPVDGAAIVFVSAGGGDYSAQGISDSEGKFSLNAFEYKDGAVPGEYMAIVTKNEEVTDQNVNLQGEEAEHAATEGGAVQLGVRNALPARYAQPSQDMAFTVPADGVTDLKIELSSQ